MANNFIARNHNVQKAVLSINICCHVLGLNLFVHIQRKHKHMLISSSLEFIQLNSVWHSKSHMMESYIKADFWIVDKSEIDLKHHFLKSPLKVPENNIIVKREIVLRNKLVVIWQQPRSSYNVYCLHNSISYALLLQSDLTCSEGSG